MRYVLGAIGVIFLAIIAVILIGRRGPAPAPAGQQVAGKKIVNITNYANKSGNQVRWTMQGRLVGEDQHRSIRITVSQDERRVDILNGYEQSVERSQNYINTSAAYDTFLHALDLAGFSREKASTIKDERGVCPLGNRFTYDLTDGSDRPVHLWSASCSRTLGTFAGDAILVRQLFQKQIPEYDKFIKGVTL